MAFHVSLLKLSCIFVAHGLIHITESPELLLDRFFHRPLASGNHPFLLPVVEVGGDSFGQEPFHLLHHFRIAGGDILFFFRIVLEIVEDRFLAVSQTQNFPNFPAAEPEN